MEERDFFLAENNFYMTFLEKKDVSLCQNGAYIFCFSGVL